MPEWSPLLWGHVVAAAVAIPLGAWNLLRPRRGDRRHRMLGYAWVLLLYWVAVSSFWIRELRPGQLSWIHGLSVLTLVTLTIGLAAAIRGRVRAHRGMMIGTYMGLIGAFMGAVAVPVRALPRFIVEEPAAFLLFLLTVAALFGLIVGLTYWFGQESTTAAPRPRP